MAISHAGVAPAIRTRRSAVLHWIAGGALLADVHSGVADTRERAGDALADQEDALSRAADGFVGSRTSDGVAGD